MSRRITGLETEYGCLVDGRLQLHEVLPRIRDWLFENHRYGLIDQHDRDWDEPAGNGGFLFNGGRVYIDMQHMEYCTPECASVADVVRYDRAGDVLLLEAVKALGLEGKVHFIRDRGAFRRAILHVLHVDVNTPAVEEETSVARRLVPVAIMLINQPIAVVFKEPVPDPRKDFQGLQGCVYQTPVFRLQTSDAS